MYTVGDAIASLKEEISEKQAQIRQLERFEDVSEKGLTEVMYHNYCETDLRYSDILGKSLLTVFPFLVYKCKGANYFHYYSKEYPDIMVRIPNSRCRGVEIVVSKYYYKQEVAEKQIKQEYLLRESELTREVNKYEEYISTSSIFKRAKLMFPSCKLPFAVIKLFGLGRQASISNIKRKYDKKFNELKKLRSSKQTKIEEAIDAYVKQQVCLKRLAKAFLYWTGEVRIFQGETAQFVTATYRMDGKELIVKEK